MTDSDTRESRWPVIAEVIAAFAPSMATADAHLHLAAREASDSPEKTT